MINSSFWTRVTNRAGSAAGNGVELDVYAVDGNEVELGVELKMYLLEFLKFELELCELGELDWFV